MIEDVFSLLEYGYSVIPIRAKSKKPLIDWAPYQDRRATPEEAEAWPAGNLAVVCGPISGGLVVVDVDKADNPWPGDPALAADLIGAPMQQTGGGGRQYWFRTPNGKRIGNSVGKIAPNVDIRGEGGYVVVPPSIHPSGDAYEWRIPPGAPGDLPVLPAWILKAIQAAPPARAGAGDDDDPGFAPILSGVGEGKRNDSAAKLAGHFFALGMPAAEVRVILSDWNRRNRPPLAEKEIEQIIVSIARRELMKTGDLSPDSDDRGQCLRDLSERFGIKLLDVVRVGGEAPYYEFLLPNPAGDDFLRVAVVSARKLINQAEWAAAIVEAGEIMPKQIGRKDKRGWPFYLNRMMAAARRVEPGDVATLGGQLREWLNAYLASRPPEEEDGLVLEPMEPVRKDGSIWIHAAKVRRFAAMVHDARFTGQRFTQLLAAQGFTRKTINVKTSAGKWHSVSMYAIPKGFLEGEAADGE